jgi:hypothetical protein
MDWKEHLNHALTLADWAKEYGDPLYGIKSVDTWRQRARGDDSTGKVYPLPDPDKWHFENIDGRWYVFDLEDINMGAGKVRQLLRDVDYGKARNAAIDDLTVARLLMNRQLAITDGQARQLLLEFRPDGSLLMKGVNAVYDQDGFEVHPTEEYSHYVRQFGRDIHKLAFRLRLIYRLSGTDEKNIPKELDEDLTQYCSDPDKREEAQIWAMRRCLWCGSNWRSKEPKRSPKSLYCSDNCGQHFLYWLEQKRKQISKAAIENISESDAIIKIVNERMVSIAEALNVIA